MMNPATHRTLNPRPHPLKAPLGCLFLIATVTIGAWAEDTLLHAPFVTPSSPKWEAAIGKFEKQDRDQAPPTAATLFIGSSSIRMWKTLATDFPNLTVINRGFGGSQIIDSIAYADRVVIPYQPKTIVLYAGDNDIAAGKDAETVLDHFTWFAAKVHHALPETRLLFIAIKPSLRRWNLAPEMIKANRLVQDYCQSRDHLGFIDVWAPMLNADGKPKPKLFIKDGLHMTATGYAIWTQQVQQALDKR